ncbi:hypothetical protein PROFUN_05744 [Planoprotostelium fungivorum]|uniref:Lipid droplet-associated hydrolase n=1 Tax=Planoprotostelium fungivorum TaxID=1890364 RepID=A0A2P6NQP8_9EUKA|nr:hypothetical protein PROFUN_05744 [Planoprotostelium fungivorum]
METVTVNDIATRTYVRRSTQQHDTAIVVVPGNPGFVDFYIEFIDKLFDRLGGVFSVYGVGHAGHGCPGQNGKRIFTLDNQIQHKRDFIVQNVLKEKHSKIIIISHSVGSYISLKVLQRYKDINIVQLINLFPTVRNLNVGIRFPVNVVMLPILRQASSGLVHYIPQWLLEKIFKAIPATQIKGVRDTVNDNRDYHCVLNALSMAYEEYNHIGELDEEITQAITAHLDKIYFLYGPKDHYAPEAYYNDMIESFPEAKAHLADESILHAFVIHHSSQVVDRIAEWFDHHKPLCADQ